MSDKSDRNLTFKGWHRNISGREKYEASLASVPPSEDGFNEVSQPLKKRPPRSKVCRKLKGPHKYAEWMRMRSPITGLRDWDGWERFCVACNRKDIWWPPTKKNSVFFEFDETATPPQD